MINLPSNYQYPRMVFGQIHVKAKNDDFLIYFYKIINDKKKTRQRNVFF